MERRGKESPGLEEEAHRLGLQAPGEVQTWPSEPPSPRAQGAIRPGLWFTQGLQFMTVLSTRQHHNVGRKVCALELVVWVQILAWPLVSCVSLIMFLNLSGPDWFHLQNGANNSIYLLGL